ncbi:MAG: beta-propeller fold lactonase family protein [Bacteroidota bacterium]
MRLRSFAFVAALFALALPFVGCDSDDPDPIDPPDGDVVAPEVTGTATAFFVDGTATDQGGGLTLALSADASNIALATEGTGNTVTFRAAKVNLATAATGFVIATDAAGNQDSLGVALAAVNFAQADLEYASLIEPLLDVRDVFDGAPTAHDALFASDAGAFLIPFDADGSILFRVIDAGASVDGLNVGSLAADEVAYLRRWVDAGAPDDSGAIPYEGATEFALVCNQLDGRVSVIDIRAGRVIRTLDFTDLGLSATIKPHDIVAEPDGSAWYVALIDANSVLKFSTDLNDLGNGVDAFIAQTTPGVGAFTTPGMLALDPDGMLYAGRSFADQSGSQSIAMIDRATMSLDEIAVPYTRPHAIEQVGDYVLSSSLSENVVVSIDVSDPLQAEVVDQISLGGGMKSLVMFDVSPDGQQAVLTSQLSQEIFLLDISDPTDLGLDGIIGVGEQPWHPTYSPDGTTLYVPNRLSNSVSVIDVATQAITATITHPALSQPHGSAITADGRFLVVSSRNTMGGYTPAFPYAGSQANPGTVVVIDTQTDTVVHVIEIGAFASGVEVVNL